MYREFSDVNVPNSIFISHRKICHSLINLSTSCNQWIFVHVVIVQDKHMTKPNIRKKYHGISKYAGEHCFYTFKILFLIPISYLQRSIVSRPCMFCIALGSKIS